MNNLEVGMYVRINDGIFKVYCIAPKEDNYNKLILERNEHLSIGDSELIIKASHNIIDLIELGDYVNGKKVTGLNYSYSNKVHGIMCNGDYGNKAYVLEPNDIKSIVTKEQFESMKYEVE